MAEKAVRHLLFLLLFFTLSFAPNICDPVNPCGCAETTCSAELELRLPSPEKDYTIEYENTGIGIMGCSHVVFDRGHATYYCSKYSRLTVVVCNISDVPDSTKFEVSQDNSTLGYLYLYKSDICSNSKFIAEFTSNPDAVCGSGPALMLFVALFAFSEAKRK